MNIRYNAIYYEGLSEDIVYQGIYSLRMPVKHDRQVLVDGYHLVKRVLFEEFRCAMIAKNVAQSPVGVVRPDKCLCSLNLFLVLVLESLSAKISVAEWGCAEYEHDILHSAQYQYSKLQKKGTKH